MSDFELSNHALQQMETRSIPVELVHKILSNPDQIIESSDQRVYQSIADFDNDLYLVRVFVNSTVEPNKIVTVYRTSKISKYYEGEI